MDRRQGSRLSFASFFALAALSLVVDALVPSSAGLVLRRTLVEQRYNLVKLTAHYTNDDFPSAIESKVEKASLSLKNKKQKASSAAASQPPATSTALFSTWSHNPTVLDGGKETTILTSETPDWTEKILSSYLGPRVLLVVLAAVYATNFPLGALMNDHLPASAATSARMVVAGLALAPFVPKLEPELRLPAVLCGFFTAMGYVTQSLALIDVDPARVSFLGSATVLWCPLLEGAIDGKPMSLREAPQTWLGAILCLAGIGILELLDPSQTGALSWSVSWGDGLALLQAVGFGTGVFWTSRMLRKNPDQALPVTATLIATTAFLSMVWCLADGWIGGTGASDESFMFASWQSLTLPGMIMDPTMRPVFAAVVWTGLISTSLNFYIELTALGRVAPSEASVLLASEPLWAALFAAAFYGTGLTTTDALGGTLIVAACLVNAIVPSTLLNDWFPPATPSKKEAP